MYASAQPDAVPTCTPIIIIKLCILYCFVKIYQPLAKESNNSYYFYITKLYTYYTFFYTVRCYLSTNISNGHSYLDTNFNGSLVLNGLVKDKTSVNACIFNIILTYFDDCETDGLSSSSCTIFFYYTTIRKSSIIIYSNYKCITKMYYLSCN